MSATTETAAQVLRTIKFLRERRGWNQAALAAAMSKAGARWHQTAVSKVEQGKRALTVDELVLLAQVFQVDLDVLFTDPTRVLPERLGPVGVVAGGLDGEMFEVQPRPSVVMWRAPAPASFDGVPAEWLHCGACGQAAWFPHGGHGRALLVEALDEHLRHRGGGDQA